MFPVRPCPLPWLSLAVVAAQGSRKSSGLGPNLLCDLRQVTCPLWTLASLLERWG